MREKLREKRQELIDLEDEEIVLRYRNSKVIEKLGEGEYADLKKSDNIEEMGEKDEI